MTLTDKIKKNKYFFFTFKLIRFLIILFLLDFSIGQGLKHFYFKQQIGRQYRALYSLEKTNEDILIFGSSRAYNNYVPDVFEARLKQTCYNTGSAGQFILYDYASLKAILNRYAPKLIFLDLIPGEFRIENDSYQRLSFLLPFYNKDTAIRSVVNLKGPFKKFKLYSSIYPYNSTLVELAAGNTAYYKSRNAVEKGYKAITGIWNSPISTETPQPYPLDTLKINIFKSFIRDCQKAGTKLIVVCSPTYMNVNSGDYSILAAEKIAKEQNVLLLDFTNDAFFNSHPELFDEPLHLNKKGSQVFTNILIDKTIGK